MPQKCTSPTRSQHKWIMDLNNNMSDQPLWSKAYTLASKYTKRERMIEFQFKFLHRRIVNDDVLTKIGLEDNSNCDFCGDGKEGLAHLFWFCPKVSSSWSSLISRLISFEVLPAQYKLNRCTLIDYITFLHYFFFFPFFSFLSFFFVLFCFLCVM